VRCDGSELVLSPVKIPDFLLNAADLVRKVYVLARPFGRWKLLLVAGAALLQGVFQVLGVTSIFPFLALAADPSRLRNSNFGSKFLEWLPPLDDGQLLLFAGIFAIVMLLLSNLVNLGAELVRNRYAFGFAHWMQVRLLRQIAGRPYGDFLEQNTGILLKKVLGDVSAYSTNVLLPMLDSMARLATIVLLVALMFFVHPQIAIGAALLMGLFYAVVFVSFSRWRSRASTRLKVSGRGSYVEAHQLLGGIKPVKVHRVEETFLRRYTDFSREQARLLSRLPILSAAPRYLIEPLAFGGLVAVVLVYAARGHDLLTIVPNLGVMALAAYRMLPAFQLLYGQVTTLTASKHAVEEVYDEFLAIEKRRLPGEAGSGGALTRPEPMCWEKEIRFEQVRFAYPRARRAVIEGLDLVIAKKTSLGIVGETGSGKSTLVDLLLGLHRPVSGRILIDGQPLTPDQIRAWQGGIGYVPQEIFLTDDTVRANIAFGIPRGEVDEKRLRESAEAAQILNFIQGEMPHGFDTMVGERGVRLSGGQRQRIGLARALYHQPELLVLDEATSALDMETEAEVMKAIRALQGRLTMVIIAHRLSTVEGCDRTLDLSCRKSFGSALNT